MGWALSCGAVSLFKVSLAGIAAASVVVGSAELSVRGRMRAGADWPVAAVLSADSRIVSIGVFSRASLLGVSLGYTGTSPAILSSIR
jgi:hypothetical protein